MSEQAKYQLFRDGKFITEFEYSNLGMCQFLKYIHQNHSYSADWALKHEGYELKAIGI